MTLTPDPDDPRPPYPDIPTPEQEERLRWRKERLHELLGAENEDPSMTWDTHLSGFRFEQPDTRPVNERCGICLGELNPQRKVPLPDSDEYAHPVCRNLPQDHPDYVRLWLRTPIEERRLRIARQYGIDPLVVEPVHVDVAEHDWTFDADGLPSKVDTTHPRPPGIVGVPQCYWDYARERGELPPGMFGV